MDEKPFWDIVRKGCPRDVEVEDWDDTLVEVLTELPPEEIVAFDRMLDDKADAAYSNDLWGAAYLINGGASDDGFYYFRLWLIGMGKKVYEAALADPDSLADVVEPDQEYECEMYGAARQAWEAKGLSEDEYDRAYQKGRKRRVPRLRGRRWDFDDDRQVRKRLPRLAALYLSEAHEE
jgi:Protein of unknown function (DUF4240)